MSGRELIAMSINGSLHSLPLVFEILDEIHESRGKRQIGDEDLESGSIRAVHTMIKQIKKIEPITNPTQPGSGSVAERIASEWLLGECPHLLPPQVFSELAFLISHLLPGLTIGSIRQTDPCIMNSESP